MKIILLILLLQLSFIVILTEQVKKTEQCKCEQILNNQKDCENFNCDWNDGKCGVRQVESYCKQQTTCPIERGCALVNKECTHFTGCTAYLLKDDTSCRALSNKCTSNGERCIALGACDSYKLQVSCSKDSTGNYCFWDTTLKVCQNADTCTKLPAQLKSNADCRERLSTCTVNPSGGCITSGLSCKDQLAEVQCVTNLDRSIKCVWSGTCKDYICINATGTITSDADCSKFSSSCTINATGNGCVDKQPLCASYLIQGQCVVSVKSQCIWQDGKCIDYVCASASDAYTLDSNCQVYLAQCTVDDDQKGCKDRPAQCSDLKKFQCSKNLAGQECYFDSVKDKCVDLVCASANLTLYTSTKCQLFLPQCTVNSTSSACKIQACADAVVDTICGKITGCKWQDSKCVAYECSSAPTTLKTEADCQNYKSGCTTNNQGCSIKTTCEATTQQVPCSIDINNAKCIWDKNACRKKVCSDVVKPTHKLCYADLVGCTTDGTKCVDLKLCKLNKSKLACILGSDGPCLWVNGACYQYSECSSVISTSHLECQNISAQCTTDGQKCVAITSCADTPTTGCYLGTDGICVKNVNDKGETSCQKFTACTQLNYKLHIQCNSINSTCTTNQTTCMDLQTNCTTYLLEENCKINSSKQLCYWDPAKLTCRSHDCTDYIKSNHADCQIADKTCTSNGTTCVLMKPCADSAQLACSNGTDGKCYYDQPTYKCRLMTCNDIADKTQCAMVPNCVSDGTKCIIKGKCEAYLTSISCLADGTDGVCIWDATTTKCSLMTKCADANAYYAQCTKYSDLCKWTPKPSNGGNSSCTAYTCSTKSSASSGSCGPIATFDTNVFEICSESYLICKSSSVTELTVDSCLKLSYYTHYWDTQTTKCTQCGYVEPVIKIDPTTGGQIVAFTILILLTI